MQVTINCLIIDDEPLARKRLCNLVKDVPELVLIEQCKTGKEAIKAIDEHEPHLIFLDIQMKDMTGFDVLKKVKHKPLVIFVTAFDMYAIKAFDFFAFDYLLKPFKRERFNQSLEKVFEYFKKDKSPEIDNKLDDLLEYLSMSLDKNTTTYFDDKISVKTGNTISFINIQDIIYILASGSYIDIFTKDKTYVLRSSLNHILNDMQNKDLMRIHRSTIINIYFIDKVIHSNYGEIDVKMKDDKLFRISKSYKKEFLKKLRL